MALLGAGVTFLRPTGLLPSSLAAALSLFGSVAPSSPLRRYAPLRGFVATPLWAAGEVKLKEPPKMYMFSRDARILVFDKSQKNLEEVILFFRNN